LRRGTASSSIPVLAQPKTIFASGIGKHSNSLRPQHTALDLATVLGLSLQTID
jgi:hypothetical protein